MKGGATLESVERARPKKPASAREKPAGAAWLRGLVGVAASLLSVGCAAGETPASPTDYRAAAAAPAEWRNFSKRLQQRLQERIAAQHEDARQFRDAVARHIDRAGDRNFTLSLRAWIESDGRVERVEFDGFDDDRAAAENLRRLLRFEGVGAPPSDMLQPVRLGLSLRPKDQEGSVK